MWVSLCVLRGLASAVVSRQITTELCPRLALNLHTTKRALYGVLYMGYDKCVELYVHITIIYRTVAAPHISSLTHLSSATLVSQQHQSGL